MFMTILAIFLMLSQDNVLAQFKVEGTNKWDTDPIEFPESDNTATYIIFGCLAAAVVTAAIIYFSNNSTDDNTENPDADADTTAMNLGKPIGLSSLTQEIKAGNKADYSPLSLYFSQQPSFLKTNSTNYAVGIRYSF